jgi:hypothetical protein
MLAMMIVALLAATMYGAMYFAIRARRGANAAVDQMRSLNIAAELITDDLQSVPPPNGTLAGPFIGTQTTGADTVEFYCLGRDPSLDDQPLGDGMRRIDLVLRTDLSPPVLERQITRNLLAPVQEPPEEQVLCRNVRGFTLQYFDGTNWQDNWDSTTVGNVLPMAVAFTIELNPTDPGNPSAAPLRVSRVIPLPCAKPTDPSQMGGDQ